jgi:hypothetical protein
MVVGSAEWGKTLKVLSQTLEKKNFLKTSRRRRELWSSKKLIKV